MTKTNLNLGSIRTDYVKGALQAEDTGNDPIVFFEKWFSEAQTAKVQEINAMLLSTVDKQHRPHSRIVLLKGIQDGGLRFFTNYNSAKGQQLEINPQVAVVFFWKELERQVRIEGRTRKISPEESDRYFYSRPLGSQISAIASPQSQTIPNREILEEKVKALSHEPKASIKRPEHWGGFHITPDYFEFWQGRHSRLHDRIVFQQQDHQWKKYRLAP